MTTQRVQSLQIKNPSLAIPYRFKSDPRYHLEQGFAGFNENLTNPFFVPVYY